MPGGLYAVDGKEAAGFGVSLRSGSHGRHYRLGEQLECLQIGKIE